MQASLVQRPYSATKKKTEISMTPLCKQPSLWRAGWCINSGHHTLAQWWCPHL